MAGIATSIKLTDMMSPALKKIIQNMNKTQEEFEQFQKLAGNSFNTSRSDAMNKSLNNIKKQMDDLNDQMNKFDDETGKAEKSVNSLGSSLSGLGGMIAGAFSAKAIGDGIKGALASADVQNSAEAQLRATMLNMGNIDQYDTLVKHAQSIQSKGIYGDEAMIGAAAEFSTYMEDAEAIKLMMDTLTDYAAGMTGGGAIDYDSMVNFATNLGKITTGAYDAMTKKGFEFTDAQKAIVKGTATEAQLVEELGKDYKKYSSDMQKAIVINSIIAESWDGMYEAMSDTPESSIIKMNNAWGDMQENLGNKLYPSISKLFDTINEHIPDIEDFLSDGVDAIGRIIEKGSEMITWLTENKQLVQDTLDTVLLLAGAYASTQLAIEGAKGAQQLFNELADASPWMLLLQIVMALGGSLLFGQHATIGMQNKIRDMWLGILIYMHLIADVVMNTVETVAGFFWGIISSAGALVDAVVSKVVEGIARMAAWAMETFSGFFTFFGGMNEATLNGLITIANDTAEKAAGTSKEANDYLNNHAFDMMKTNAKELGEMFTGGDAYDKSLVDANRQMDMFMDWANIKGGYEGSNAPQEDPRTHTPSGYDTYLQEKKKYEDSHKPEPTDTDKNIEKNTGATAKALEITNEDLKYLRQIAERDVINRFTTASIKVDMTNNNNINSDMDIDGFIGTLETKLYESMSSAAEGVYV